MNKLTAAAAFVAIPIGLGLSSVYAAQEQSYLSIFAETRSTKMIGMPDMSQMARSIPPAILAKNPQLAAMMGGGAQRVLDVRLWSPGLAPPEASAVLAIPPGLKLGDHLDLELFRPEPATSTPTATNTTPGNSTFTMPDFKIKYYWGSSPTVRPGQPLVVDISKMMTPEMIANMRTVMNRMHAAGAHAGAGQGQYFYKPDWTVAHWPTSTSGGSGNVDKEAALGGTYTLTSFAGNVSLDVPPNVNFLAPIQLTSPPLDAPPPLEQAMDFKWNAVPEALGYNMMITGMGDQNTLVIWQSSEVRADRGMDWNYMQMSQVRELVKETVLMAGDRTEAIVPAGIFQDSNFVSMRMIGYGPGAARSETQPLPRAQTKTTLTVMLGGKMMQNMRQHAHPPTQ